MNVLQAYIISTILCACPVPYFALFSAFTMYYFTSLCKPIKGRVMTLSFSQIGLAMGFHFCTDLIRLKTRFALKYLAE